MTLRFIFYNRSWINRENNTDLSLSIILFQLWTTYRLIFPVKIKYGGRRMIGISWTLNWSKTLKELIFNPYGKFQWSPEGLVSQINSPHLHAGPLDPFCSFRSVQMLKREWGEEICGKIPHPFIPSETGTLDPEFAVEDLNLGRTSTLVAAFAVKDLPLGRTHWWWWLNNIKNTKCSNK